MRKISFMTMLCASLMCMGLFSCGEDEVITEQPEPTPEEPVPDPDPEPEQVRYVDIDYVLNCSEDLLEYATPQVTYVDDDGQEVTVQIADSEWEVDEDVIFSVTFEDVSLDAKVLKWTKRIHREEFPVDDEMTITYIPKADMPEYDEEKVNKFFRRLSVDMQFVDKKENNTTSVFGGNTGSGNVGVNVFESLDYITDVYIDAGLFFLQERNTMSSIIIGVDEETMRSMIYGYQNMQGIRVESDGTYTFKYEDPQLIEKTPQVDIAYTLNCSEEFLKYAIPQVTYTGNDGNPVTYQIDESEFEVNEKVNKWAKHLHENELMDDGEEAARIMKWTKRIHYDDLQAVDDKMSVTYIPKEGYDGKLRTSHIFQNLSSAFRVLDDEGEVMVLLSENSIDSDTVQGESKMVWKFMDSSGNPIIIDSPYFVPQSKFLDSSGTVVFINEAIIRGYKGFQGFHIEKDGTYEMLTE